MNIGIDFDNTIARYDASFKEVVRVEGFIAGDWNGQGKTQLRDHLRRKPDGEKIWMKLQGLVYGKFMHRAEMMPGVANFLLQCKARNHSVFIVSHKTEYGHFDPGKISLRREALKWMRAKRFFDPGYHGIKRENVIFADTREEKAEIISGLDCDYFIDDLPEVFAEEKIQTCIQKILFLPFGTMKSSDTIRPMSNWRDISSYVFGPATDDDVGLWASLMSDRPFKRVNRISGRGNSRLYKAVTADGKHYALKQYPDRLTDARPRLKTEFHAFRLLRQHNIDNVPMAVEMDEDLNLGLYGWIEGELVTGLAANDLKQAVDFVKQLHCLSLETGANGVELASEACLSASELIGQIEERWKRLHAAREDVQGLSSFLRQTFEPVWEEVKDKSRYLWPIGSRDNSLPRQKQTLSPSDFGFHNALKEDEKITFIDFEYFGWDDPVKLTADFLWHPAMELSPEAAAQWEEAMLDIFSGDPEFASRLHAAMPLYGLRWAMIVLNEFLPGFAERRKRAGERDTYDLEMSRIIQLGKAERYCERVAKLSSSLTVA